MPITQRGAIDDCSYVSLLPRYLLCELGLTFECPSNSPSVVTISRLPLPDNDSDAGQPMGVSLPRLSHLPPGPRPLLHHPPDFRQTQRSVCPRLGCRRRCPAVTGMEERVERINDFYSDYAVFESTVACCTGGFGVGVGSNVGQSQQAGVVEAPKMRLLSLSRVQFQNPIPALSSPCILPYRKLHGVHLFQTKNTRCRSFDALIVSPCIACLSPKNPVPNVPLIVGPTRGRLRDLRRVWAWMMIR